MNTDNYKNIKEYYKNNINPQLYSAFKILGLDNLDYVSSKGMFINLQNGEKIYDFTSGLGVLNLGHNHPKINEVEIKCIQRDTVDFLKIGVNKQQALLANYLTSLLPKKLNKAFFTASGGEAIEAALKIVMLNTKKRKFLTFNESYHGKTLGSLSVTNAENYNDNFLIGLPRENILLAEFNSIESVGELISQNSDIAAVIIEPIQGQRIRVGDKKFLKDLIKICKTNEIITIFDEIKVGMGRTGHLFSFMDYGIEPDMVTISKSLGGGSRAIGAMVTTNALFKKAYGKRSNASLHSTTFNGIGTTCEVARESLNIISNDEFLQEVRNKGDYFFDELIKLKKEYPNKIKNILGKGLFLGVELIFPAEKIKNNFNNEIIKTRDQFFIATIINGLYKNHNILSSFAPSAPEVLDICPPLIIDFNDIDYFISSFKSILSKNYAQLGKDLMKNLI